MKCQDKVEYASAMLATNAAWLHGAAHPTCPGVEHYEHDGHWHIGHADWASSVHCQDDNSPIVRRPRRVQAGRRYETAKARAAGVR